MKNALKRVKKSAPKYTRHIQQLLKDDRNGGGIYKKLLPPLMRTQPINEVTQVQWAFNYVQLDPR